MTSVGYGDNGPKNVLERVACTWLLGRSFKNAYIGVHMGDCQNYGPFLGLYYNTGPNLGDPKRDHNFDNLPYRDIIYRDHRGSKSGEWKRKRQPLFGV